MSRDAHSIAATTLYLVVNRVTFELPLFDPTPITANGPNMGMMFGRVCSFALRSIHIFEILRVFFVSPGAKSHNHWTVKLFH